jgi:long-chain acyl-CoA synthetase
MNAASSETAAATAPFLSDRGNGVASFLINQAAQQGRHPAAVHNGKTYSYGDVLLRATCLAAELRQRGITRGDRVGLLFLNHSDYIASFFAATGIGAVVIPINPLLKSAEIAHILSDSNARAVIVHERGLGEVSAACANLIDLQHLIVLTYEQKELNIAVPQRINAIALASETLSESGKKHPNFVWERNIDNSADLAVLVYTSGTTGKPKGAMLTHSNLLAAVDMSHKVLDISKDDKFIVIIPMCHIYGLTVVMLGLLSKGGTLAIVDKFEAASALQLIESERVTLLPAVPAIYQFLLMELEKGDYDLSSLRACLSGGAPMPVEMFPQLVAKFPGDFLEGYGLTETSSVVAINPVRGVKKRGSVGVPLGSIEVAIVDPDGTHLPHTSAHIGEIAVRGGNVMRGYFGKPEATAECMKDGWFFTGDLGYRDEEGYLFIVGRTKEMIIRGGQNIYPREIEDVIMRLPEVAEVAVVGVADQYMGERVKAVIVLKPGMTLDEDAIKVFCASNLAEYKVPRLVEFVDALPRNSTGKVLKRLLQG